MNKKISDKDKKDWDEFISSKDHLPDKDLDLNKKKIKKIFTFDLHGYSLNDANTKINEIINLDFKSNFSWMEDQMILNECDLIVGPPSTFTMWASYISETPLIQISKNGSFDLRKAFICKG